MAMKYDTSGSVTIRLRFYMDAENMLGGLYPRLKKACTDARFTIADAVSGAGVGAVIDDSGSVQNVLFHRNRADEDFPTLEEYHIYDTYDVAADLEIKLPFRMMADRISGAFRKRVQEAAATASDDLRRVLSEVGAAVHEDSSGARFVLCSCWPAMY